MLPAYCWATTSLQSSCMHSLGYSKGSGRDYTWELELICWSWLVCRERGAGGDREREREREWIKGILCIAFSHPPWLDAYEHACTCTHTYMHAYVHEPAYTYSVSHYGIKGEFVENMVMGIFHYTMNLKSLRMLKKKKELSMWLWHDLGSGIPTLLHKPAVWFF